MNFFFVNSKRNLRESGNFILIFKLIYNYSFKLLNFNGLISIFLECISGC